VRTQRHQGEALCQSLISPWTHQQRALTSDTMRFGGILYVIGVGCGFVRLLDLDGAMVAARCMQIMLNGILVDETVSCLALFCDSSKCAVFETCSICGANASELSRCLDGVGHDDPLACFATHTTTTPLRPARSLACIFDFHRDHIRPLCILFVV
jgi:hypothetical protein